MQNQLRFLLLIILMGTLILTACSANSETADWKIFTIEQEPGFDIQFRLPPGWLVDFAPTRDKPGQWDVVLVPPKCHPDQEVEFQENCINLITHIKGTSTFNQNEFTNLISSDIPLGPDPGQTAQLLGTDEFRVNRLNISRYNHLITTAQGEVQMSTFFIETDGAYYTFITNFPYPAVENETSQAFDLLIDSLALAK